MAKREGLGEQARENSQYLADKAKGVNDARELKVEAIKEGPFKGGETISYHGTTVILDKNQNVVSISGLSKDNGGNYSLDSWNAKMNANSPLANALDVKNAKVNTTAGKLEVDYQHGPDSVNWNIGTAIKNVTQKGGKG